MPTSNIDAQQQFEKIKNLLIKSKPGTHIAEVYDCHNNTVRDTDGDTDGYNLVDIAVIYGHDKAAKALQSNGTPLTYLTKVIATSKKQKALFNEMYDKLKPAEKLGFIIRQNDELACEYLDTIPFDVDLSLKDELDRNLLDLAVKYGRKQVSQQLINRGVPKSDELKNIAQGNKQLSLYNTLVFKEESHIRIIQALKANDLTALKFVLGLDADTEQPLRDVNHYNVLTYAIKYGRQKTALALMEKGLFITQIEQHAAKDHGQEELYNILAQEMKPVNQLYFQIRVSDKAALGVLKHLPSHIELSSKDELDRTPLELAVKYGRVETAKELIRRGQPLSVKSLQIAFELKNLQIIDELLSSNTIKESAETQSKPILPLHSISKIDKMGVRSLTMEIRHRLQDSIDIEGVNYHVVTGETNFVTQNSPVITIGGSDREAPYLDPSSPFINSIYRLLTNRIEKTLVSENRVYSIQEVYGILKKMIGELFEHSFKQEKHLALVNSHQVKAPSGTTITAVNMEQFMLVRAGVCRHGALLSSYLLGRLVREGYLPQFDVRIARDAVGKSTAHATTILRDQDELWLADAINGYLFRLTGDQRTRNDIEREESYIKFTDSRFVANLKSRFGAKLTSSLAI